MENTIKKTQSMTQNRWLTGLTGAIAVILGIWTILNPITSVIAMTWIFGIVLLVSGISGIVNWYQLKDSTGQSAAMLFNPILSIVFAAVLLFTHLTSLGMLATLFAVWFIVDSCTGFSFADFTNHPVLQKTFSVIGVILGVILLFSPLLSLGALVLTVGIFLIIYGVMSIFKAV
ncbi:DUF308 domain-containing protein [Levilactobacillus brevis]|uniref:HdeD family acid-resistance protein n=1 Tax=Levilactobacillus brevis TaxID=1580 RepID=UPI001BAB31B5|nr:DUF308 domain-containing protein [Levilactobacillus brevis]MBS1007133.1 DUF308 domain-containing protein [Levilactobacillus brevis]